jgi:hypothetical protein
MTTMPHPEDQGPGKSRVLPGDESSTGEEADEVSTSGDTEDEIEDKVSADTGLEPVAGKNAAATTSEPGEASVTGGKVMAMGAGALFLAAGVYVARRTFWSWLPGVASGVLSERRLSFRVPGG